MNTEQIGVFKAVEKINNELYKKYSKKNPKNYNYDSLDLMPVLGVTFANAYTFVTLSVPSNINIIIPEITLYHSENNDRIFYEKKGTYETYYKYIKRKFREAKEEIYAIKL